MFFSNVVQFSRSYPLPLSLTASLLYHPLPPLSTPFRNLFFKLASPPCVLSKTFNLLWKMHCPSLYIIYILFTLSFRRFFPAFWAKCTAKSPEGSAFGGKTLSITFSLVMLEFFVRMIYNNCYSVCACSSVDRAPASGAGCVGSIPVRRTKSTSLHCREVLFSCSNLIFPCSSVFPCSKAPAWRSSSVLKSIFRCSTKKAPVLKRRRRFRCVSDSRTFVLQCMYSRREQFAARLRKTQAA